MDWNGSMRPFVPRAESSFSFLYDYNCTPYPGMEVKHPAFAERPPQGLLEEMEKMRYGGGNQQQLEKKKRLTGEQLEALERSFQEEIKLEPDRKMKLSRELGLQPRQIAVWFQNRRARWKGKQIEHLYGSLKQEFDVVSKQNQKLQEEVMKLRAMVREQAYYRTQQVSADMSGDETVESTSEAMLMRRSKTAGTIQQQHMTAEANYSLTAEEYCNTVSLPHWAVVPYYP